MSTTTTFPLPAAIRRVLDREPLGLGIPFHRKNEVILLGGGGTPAQELVAESAFADALRDAINDPRGPVAEEQLRTWVARYESAHRDGAEIDASQVVLTTGGGQRAIIDAARAVVDAGDVVVVEDPTYLGALAVFNGLGVDLVPIGVDADGLVVDELEARLQSGLRPRLLYTVPTFQNPTGAELPLERRQRLAELADQYDFLILEDDPYGDLRYRGTELVHIAALAPDRTIVVGTFSKTITTRWRIGWTVAPRALVPAVTAASQLSGGGPSYIYDALVRLLEQPGWFEHGVADRIRVYGSRLAHLRSELEQQVGDALDIGDPAGGLFLWLRVKDQRFTSQQLAAEAARREVYFVQAQPFTVATPLPYDFRLTFAPLSESRATKGVTLLAESIRALTGN